MRVAVLGDTHVPSDYPAIPAPVLEALAGSDAILHCGDIVHPGVLEFLSAYAPVWAIAGNHDRGKPGIHLPRRRVVELGGRRIGMIHGDEAGGVHVTKSMVIELLHQAVLEPFIAEEPCDCIVFGHTHKPMMDVYRVAFEPRGPEGPRVKHNVLLLNPGSPNSQTRVASMGFLDLAEGELRAEIRLFQPPGRK